MKGQQMNAILADCDENEVKSFLDGLNDGTPIKFVIRSCVSNGSHRGWTNFVRYMKYFTYPLEVFFHRKHYKNIIGWQQFYAINFAFYCRLFHVKKVNDVIALNFTYKDKNGIIGKVYKAYMNFALHGDYINYLHVLSNNYAKECAQQLNLPLDKFIATPFGVPDYYEKWNDSSVDEKNYTLSIGRSNRDFDFLVKVWKQPTFSDYKLVIISDTYQPKETLPDNILLFDNITGDASFPWIANCNMMILPIDDGRICSGDTVLLSGMLFKKTVVVTAPSTLSEMYINNGVDGICAEKDLESFSASVLQLLKDEDDRKRIGENARKKKKKKYSRYIFGHNLQKFVKYV